MRDYMIFCREFLESMEYLEDNQKLVLYDAICKYALDGIEPDKDEMIRLDIIGNWVLIKARINFSLKNAENGAKGGRPKKNAFCDYQQRDIDFDDLEKKVYKNGNSV